MSAGAYSWNCQASSTDIRIRIPDSGDLAVPCQFVSALDSSRRELVIDRWLGELLYCAAEAIDAGFRIKQRNFDSALVRHSGSHPTCIMAYHRQARGERL